jgi:hypothetical protein
MNRIVLIPICFLFFICSLFVHTCAYLSLGYLSSYLVGSALALLLLLGFCYEVYQIFQEYVAVQQLTDSTKVTNSLKAEPKAIAPPPVQKIYQAVSNEDLSKLSVSPSPGGLYVVSPVVEEQQLFHSCHLCNVIWYMQRPTDFGRLHTKYVVRI